MLEVQHLTKEFKIGAKQERYLSLRDALAKPFRKKDKEASTFLALDDINFNVGAGESIGIIGRNGAGKSTLLKILSRITPPSSGKIVCRGRVASLLEVGTGFHPELSGRENVYMNGSILGMRKAEINKHFDSIVDFSGVEKFLDTPLKRYSSGMQLRLAFSVAAFLEPEILIIDEVLAVGDAEFQKKCLNKMKDVSMNEGRTVLFVSHDMNAIKTLSNTAILLDGGKIVKNDKVGEVIPLYLNRIQLTNNWKRPEKTAAPHFTNVSIVIKDHQPQLKLEVTFTVKSDVKMNKAFVAFNISSNTGTMIGQAIPNLDPFIDVSFSEQTFKTEIEITGFVPGTFLVSAWIGPHYSETYDWQKDIVGFNIVDSPQPGRVYPHASEQGNIVPFSKMINS
ncbi:MAG: ATP-binding cassette domain-containing protein [Chitinophagaceae bacterium]|nr:ATP-binding cassette domain-containing protein [Chitinophagaceae bacterium]